MTFAKKLTAAALASIFAFGGVLTADTWTGAGADNKWETAANWEGGVVPLNAGIGNTFVNSGDMLFDADSFAFLAAQTDGLRNPTEYRGVVRLLTAENNSAGDIGDATITFNQGAGNLVLNGNSTTVLGGRVGGTHTLNVQSGILNLGNDFLVAPRVGSTAITNVTGGTLIVARDGIQLGGVDGGNGTLNISGGEFLTRTFGRVGPEGRLNVIGAGATQIGIGTQGTGTGSFLLEGTLGIQVDSTAGITPIFVDEVDAAPADATLAAGSILDLSFVDSPASATTTYTVLELENADIIDNGLALSATTDSGWSFSVDNSGPNGLLTATFTDSNVLLGDINLDGAVNFLDITPFIAVLAAGTAQPEADTNQDGEVNFLDIVPFISILSTS